MTQEMYEKAIEILKKPKDSTISTPKRLIGYINFTYFFTKRYKTTYIDVLNVYLQVRQHFELQEDTIVKGKYILIKKTKVE